MNNLTCVKIKSFILDSLYSQVNKGLKYNEMKPAKTELEFGLFQSHELLDFLHLKIHTNGVLPLESPISGSNFALRSSSKKAALPVVATVSKLKAMLGVNIFFSILHQKITNV